MSSTTLDLDITNYTPTDLIHFFKLSPNNCSFLDIQTVAKNMTDNVLKSNSMSSDETTNIINFIKKAEKILEILLKNSEKNTEKDTEKNSINFNDSNNINNTNYNILTNKIHETNPGIINPYNNVGKIINPNSISHQSLQKQSIPSNSVNPYTGNIYVKNFTFNTQFRDNFFFTQPENCTFTLPLKLKNVVAVSLSAVQIPNVMLPFSEERGTNSIYIYEETTNLQGFVIIPTGNYTIYDFPSALQEAINLQIIGSLPGRFQVSIDPKTYYTTISNTTYKFRMNILKSTPLNLDVTCNDPNYDVTLNPDNIVTKDNINVKVSNFVTTMGYLIGYRQVRYSGFKSYRSESMFNNIYTDYVYFCMNEYSSSSQYITNIGVLPEGLIDNNVLAIVPITTPKFISTYADNSDFIYKTRNYNGPIDIQKISIKILNAQGALVNLHNFDYGFNLQVTSIYDIMQPYQPLYNIY